MSNLLLRLEGMAGASIDNCAAEAIGLANRLQITVMFKFNGVNCMACPGDNPMKLAEEAMSLMGIKTDYKLARGRPATTATKGGAS